MAIAEIVDVVEPQAQAKRQCSRSFQNGRRRFDKGKHGGFRVHSSMNIFHGIIRQKRTDEPADYVYVEGTSEPATSR